MPETPLACVVCERTFSVPVKPGRRPNVCSEECRRKRNAAKFRALRRRRAEERRRERAAAFDRLVRERATEILRSGTLN